MEGLRGVKIQNGFSLKPDSPQEKAAKIDDNLRGAAKMYENHFLNEMVKSMRSTVGRDENSFMKQNMAEKIFSEQLDQQYVDGWANKGGIGLADMIYSQIKDQYFNTTKKDFSHPGGALPIAPKREINGLKPTDSIQMKMIPVNKTSALEYRFEVSDPDVSGRPGQNYEALAPMAGKVVESTKLGENWTSLKLDHGRGVSSELTFPGTAEPIPGGTAVEAGQRLGQLDPSRPVLAWKLDWQDS